MFAFTVYTMGIIPIYNLSTYAEDLRTKKKTNTTPHCKVTNVVSASLHNTRGQFYKAQWSKTTIKKKLPCGKVIPSIIRDNRYRLLSGNVVSFAFFYETEHTWWLKA